MTSKNSVEVKDLVVHFETVDGVVKAVNNISFNIEKGKTLGLVGETGAGKTTAALSILRLIPNPPGKIKQGQIILEGKKLFEYDSEGEAIEVISENEMEKIRGNEVSMIFQDPMTSLNPVMTVESQISEVIEIHQDVDKKQALKKAGEMLELVGIPAARGIEYPHQFSGGMKQRVIIAIALACNPNLLIADEPTTALDVTIQAQVLEMMRDLRNKLGTSMLMITHDLGVVSEICDEVAIMYAGEIVEYGTLEDIFNHTSHPYTEGLFNSLPNIENRYEMLKPIRGLMPDPTNLPEGCPFHPRCEYATDLCKTRKPKLTKLDGIHYVTCLAYEKGTEIKMEGGRIENGRK